MPDPRVFSYDHLIQLPDGAEDFGVHISLQGFSPGGEGSDHIPKGRFPLRTAKLQVVSKKLSEQEQRKSGGRRTDPSRKVLRYTFSVVYPADEAIHGRRIVMNAPAPRTAQSLADQMADFGYQRLQQIAWSIATGKGEGLVEKLMTKESLPIVAKATAEQKGKVLELLGSISYAVVRDGEGDFSNRSEVAFFISKDECEARPGPDATIPDHIGGAQSSAPELFGGGASASGGGGKPAAANGSAAGAAGSAPAAGGGAAKDVESLFDV